MAFIPMPNCVRTSIIFNLGNQTMVNTLWFRRDAPWTAEQREELNTTIRDWWNTTGKLNHAGGIMLAGVTTVNQDAENSPSSALAVSPMIAGSNGATATQNNVALCVTLRTALRGRSYRGRMYLAGFPAATVNDTVTCVAAALTGILSALNALKSLIEALGATWVVVSKFHNKVARVQGVATPVSALTMDTYWDSQRRRLGLRGV